MIKEQHSKPANLGTKIEENCSLEELDLEIITCSIRRLSTKEALEYLHSKGHKIEERNYYSRKKKLRELNIKRVTSGMEDLVAQHFKMIDSLELLQKNLWQDLDITKDSNLRLKIMNTIRENQNYLLKYYETIPTIVDNQIDSFRKIGYVQEIEYTNYRIRDRIRNIKQTLESDEDRFKLPQVLPDPLSQELKNKLLQELKELESKNEKIIHYDDNEEV